MYFDLAILIVAALAVVGQYQTRKKVKALQGFLVELEPLLNEFSRDVDRTESSIEMMKNSAEEVVGRIAKEATDVEKRVRLLGSASTARPRYLPGNPSLFHSDKSSMISQIFDTARMRT